MSLPLPFFASRLKLAALTLALGSFQGVNCPQLPADAPSDVAGRCRDGHGFRRNNPGSFRAAGSKNRRLKRKI
jgi:hypothetical protein